MYAFYHTFSFGFNIVESFGFSRITFFLHLFFGKLKTLPPIVGYLSTFPVNKSGMSLHNPMTPEKEKHTSSLHASDDLIGAVKGEQVFSTAHHISAVKG